MAIDECIGVLLRQGMIVEPDLRAAGRWLVFSTNDPAEIENGGWPDFYDDAGLIQLAQTYLLELSDGDCPRHPHVAELKIATLDCVEDNSVRSAGDGLRVSKRGSGEINS